LLAGMGVALLAFGIAIGSAWLFFLGCACIGAAPIVALSRLLARYKPQRAYDRSFLADVLGTSSTPHERRPDGDDADPPDGVRPPARKRGT
jgi:hypothetical protein